MISVCEENTFGNEECREVWWAPPPISDLGICVCAAPARPVSLSAPALSSQVSLVSHAAQSTLTGVTREDNPEVDKWNCLSMEMQEKEN